MRPRGAGRRCARRCCPGLKSARKIGSLRRRGHGWLMVAGRAALQRSACPAAAHDGFWSRRAGSAAAAWQEVEHEHVGRTACSLDLADAFRAGSPALYRGGRRARAGLSPQFAGVSAHAAGAAARSGGQAGPCRAARQGRKRPFWPAGVQGAGREFLPAPLHGRRLGAPRTRRTAMP